jgi:branched-chain amino acid aminotransferase
VSFLPACWVDGARVDPGRAHLLVTDRGLTLADGVFETMRAHRGVIFRFADHMARLSRGAERLGLPRPAELTAMLDEAMREIRTHHADAVVRLTVTRGPGRHGLAPSRSPGPATIVLLVQDVGAFPASVSVLTASGRRNEHAMSAGLKTLSYTDSILAMLEATQKGADDAIFLDTAGHVAEATASNVFVVRGGAVRTPPTTCGAFPGITRGVVIELLRGLDITVTEHPVSPAELAAADEVFLTSSVREIAPVDTLDGRTLRAPGEVTTAVVGAYRAQVLVERER